MDTTIILAAIIGVLLIERAWYQHQTMKQNDQMNKALLAKNVPEYNYNTGDEIKKMKVENALAIETNKLIESQDARGPHHPVS